MYQILLLKDAMGLVANDSCCMSLTNQYAPKYPTNAGEDLTKNQKYVIFVNLS